MSSKTRVLKLVKGLRWKELRSDLAEDPRFLGYRDEKGRNLLHLCCGVHVAARGLKASDSIRTADVLLDAGLGIDEPAFGESDWKATPLWFTVAFGDNLTLAKHLIERGASPQYCMWAAVNRDNPEMIRLLVRSGADDPTNPEGSPLFAAVDWKKPAAAVALLKLGADVNYQGKDGRTALHVALKKRRDEDFVRLLVDHGARGDIEDADGETALEIMMRKRDPAFRAMAERLTLAL